MIPGKTKPLPMLAAPARAGRRFRASRQRYCITDSPTAQVGNLHLPALAHRALCLADDAAHLAECYRLLDDPDAAFEWMRRRALHLAVAWAAGVRP